MVTNHCRSLSSSLPVLPLPLSLSRSASSSVMHRQPSPLGIPEFNPLANSNDSDRSSSSNTTVTVNGVNAFSNPKRPDLSTVFPQHAVHCSNGSGGVEGNALNVFQSGDCMTNQKQFDAAKARLDASCWVQNVNSTSSMSQRSSQFLDEFGGLTPAEPTGGGAASSVQSPHGGTVPVHV